MPDHLPSTALKRAIAEQELSNELAERTALVIEASKRLVDRVERSQRERQRQRQQEAR